MRVFVTGATGYVGGAVVTALLEAGHDVAALVRSGEAAGRLEAAGCRPHVGDIGDPAGLAPAIADADAVVHTAVGTGGGIVGEVDDAAVDAMVDALAARRGTLVLTSGLAIYAGYRVPLIDESTPLADVAATQRPRVALEERVLAAAARRVRPVVIRPGHVYGGGGAGLFTRTLIDASRAAGAGIVVGGEGTGAYGTVHRDDLAAAYLAALRHDAVTGCLNVVAANLPMLEVAAALGHAVGADGGITTMPLDEALERWGPRAHVLLGLPPVSSVLVTARLGWRPAGPSLAYELIHGTLSPGGARAG